MRENKRRATYLETPGQERQVYTAKEILKLGDK
jgi:hypothetical protein